MLRPRQNMFWGRWTTICGKAYIHTAAGIRASYCKNVSIVCLAFNISRRRLYSRVAGCNIKSDWKTLYDVISRLFFVIKIRFINFFLGKIFCWCFKITCNQARLSTVLQQKLLSHLTLVGFCTRLLLLVSGSCSSRSCWLLGIYSVRLFQADFNANVALLFLLKI